MNLRPSGYEPDELPGCSTPRLVLLRLRDYTNNLFFCQTFSFILSALALNYTRSYTRVCGVTKTKRNYNANKTTITLIVYSKFDKNIEL